MTRPGDVASNRSTGVIALMALCAAAAPWLVASVLPPMAQPQSYHDFADQRTLWGIPHALNVLSNLPFVVVGLDGIAGAREPGSIRFDRIAPQRARHGSCCSSAWH